jgi:NitT/TauT family transport system substrate-binding protein
MHQFDRPARRAVWRSSLAVLAVLLLAGAAAAQEKLRVGKAVPHAYSFTPLNIGIETGIFRAHGLDIQEIDFSGSAKMHQGMIVGGIDLGLGAGPDLAFVAKGSPEIGVAAMAGPPLLLGILVTDPTTIHAVADLKGKRIGVSTVASLTYWLALELARTQGWGPNGVTPVAIGGELAGELAALRTHQVDAMIDAVAIGFQLEEQKQGRLLIPVSDYVHDFITHVIFASNTIVQTNPNAVRGFLKAWFETIAYIRTHRTETIEMARKVTGFSPAVEAREYDLVTPMFSADGCFQQAALDTLSRSFITLGLLDHQPDMSKLYTEAFLPDSK